MICRHCQRAKVTRPRGLCWACYYAPGVRELYSTLSKYGRRGLGNFNGFALPPSFPTQALPGSPEKIAVLTERANNCQQLFHPGDATFRQPAQLAPVG